MMFDTDLSNWAVLGVPEFLLDAMRQYIDIMNRRESGEKTTLCGDYFCLLQSEINIAEVEQIISPDLAWQIREEYLGIDRNEKGWE